MRMIYIDKITNRERLSSNERHLKSAYICKDSWEKNCRLKKHITHLMANQQGQTIKL